jgi:hypothetical protein
MTDEPNGRPNDRTIARQNRLRDALRENLKRRKSQSRGRTAVVEHDAAGPGPVGSNSVCPADPKPDETT